MPNTKTMTLAAMALAALSCTKELGSGAGEADNGTITASSPTEGVTAAAPSSTGTPAQPIRLRPVRQTGGIEAVNTPPSPAVLAAVAERQQRLDGVAAGIPGATVRFVDCAEAVCTSRLEAKSLAGLRELLQAVGADGPIGFTAREQLNAYTGQTFVADVSFGGEHTRPVPSDENELLVNDVAP